MSLDSPANLPTIFVNKKYINVILCNFINSTLLQLEDLQNEYTRLSQQSARKEENFKKEIQDLHKVFTLLFFNWFLAADITITNTKTFTAIIKPQLNP